ncbi:hypothetical protein Tco_0020945 [Tanacetum coccineum]
MITRRRRSPPGDIADDKEEDEGEDKEEEEEEHLAPADSIPSPQTGTRVARMTVLPQPPIAASTKALITTVAATLPLPLPPPSPLTSYSSPLPQIPSPPLPTCPDDAGAPLGYIAAMIRLRAESPSTSHPLPLSTPPSGTPLLLPIPLPTSSPPLLLPSTSRRADVPEVTLPPRKRLCIALGPRYEVGESSSAPTARPTRGFRADYGFVATLDDEIRRDPKREVGYGITDTWDDMDTYEIYVRLDDAQDDRSLMRGQLNMMRRDRRTHARTARLMETEAILSREAWLQSIDASDIARSKVRALQTTVLVQQAEIGALRATDHTRQAQLTKALTLMRTLQIQVTAL